MNEQYRKDFIRAGAIARQVRSFGKSLIQPGASYNAAISQICQKIKELDAIPAFPPQIALNDVAAHFLPQPGNDIIFTQQVVKLDVGICFNGAIGDCAVTVDLSGKYSSLVDAAEAALLNAERSIKVGLPIREIGRIIGYYKIHTAPSIPNCDDSSTGVIRPGMTFAIEPFATNGKGLIYEASNPTIFCFMQNRPVQSGFAKALLPKIKAFKGLPFSFHDLLSEELSLIEIRLALNELMHSEIITGYPPLIEEAHGVVAQAENSVLVDKGGTSFLVKRIHTKAKQGLAILVQEQQYEVRQIMIEIHPIIYPVFSLIAGILILIFPPILNFIVAIYLILIGIMGIIGH
jgi:methionyl aminopeptidase